MNTLERRPPGRAEQPMIMTSRLVPVDDLRAYRSGTAYDDPRGRKYQAAGDDAVELDA